MIISSHEIPELSKQVEITPVINEESYKTIPRRAKDFYENNAFSGSY